MFLRQFSPDVTLIPKWRVALSDAQRKELADSDVVVLEGQVERLAATASATAVQLWDGPVARRFDILYPASGLRTRSELAKRQGALAADEVCLAFGTFSSGLLHLGSGPFGERDGQYVALPK